MRKTTQNKLMLFSLISINLLLFSLIASAWYISKQGKKQLVNHVENISDVARKELRSIAEIKDSLSDLTETIKNINPSELKELSKKAVSDALNKAEELKIYLEKKSKELSSTLGEKLNLSELSSELSKIEKKLGHLKEMEESFLKLSNLEDIALGVKDLEKNLSTLNNLEGIKNEISTVSSKINSEEIGKGIGSQIDNDKIANQANAAIKEALEKKLEGLNSEIKKTLKSELKKRGDQIFCPMCKKIECINTGVKLLGMSLKFQSTAFMKEEEWIELIKKETFISNFPLEFRISSESIKNGTFITNTKPNWTDYQDVYKIKRRESPIFLERQGNIDIPFDLESALEHLKRDLNNTRKIQVEFNLKEIECKCGDNIKIQGLENSADCLLKILKGIS